MFILVIKNQYKKGKELQVSKFKDYSVVYGGVNNKAPKALYVHISSWATPLIDDVINYNRIIRDIDKQIRQVVYNHISAEIASPFFKDRSIVDLDIKKSGVKFGKKSFVDCEITLFLKYEVAVNSEVLKPEIDSMIELIVKQVFEKNKYFKFSKNKK